MWRILKDKRYNDEELYDKYKVMRENDRIKLHSKYISCISVGIVIWLITTGTSSDAKFTEWISFASTITSIILSVIAIIMSISGESKSDAMREKMEETAKEFKKTAEDIKDANEENIRCMDDLTERVVTLQKVIENIPEETAKKINNAYIINDTVEKDIRDIKMGWLKNEK